MTSERRIAMKRLSLRLTHGAWQLHGTPQIRDDQVDTVAEADWQALIHRWCRNQVR